MEKVKFLIYNFLNQKFDILELKNRLSTLYFENDTKLESDIRTLENDLESIFFCYNNDEYYFEAKKVLDIFLLNHS